MWTDDEEPDLTLVDQKWENAMLHEKRHVVRVAKDGSDEVITTSPFAEACYVNLAKEIIHRIRGTKSGRDLDIELMSDFNLDFLMKIRGEHLSSPADRDAVSLLRVPISTKRSQTFNCPKSCNCTKGFTCHEGIQLFQGMPDN